MEYFERIIDINTGEETIRPYTDEEVAAHEKAAAEYAAQRAALQVDAAQRQAEKERIAGALGITLDELKVLLG